MGFSCTPRPYFFFMCLNAMDECVTSVGLCFKVINAISTLILEACSIYHVANLHIVNFFRKFVVNCITSFIKHTCEAKPTTLKRPSLGEGLRITCLVLTIIEAQN